MCHDSEYAWGSKYAKILNMAKYALIMTQYA